MKIDYKRWVVNLNLFFGLGYLVYFFIHSLEDQEFAWMDYSSLVLAIIFLNIYFYQRQNKYLTIENGTITKNMPFGRTINAEDIIEIKNTNGIYILKTEETRLTINSTIIDHESLFLLKTELQKMKVSLL